MSKAEGAELPTSVSYRIFLVFFGMTQISLAAGLIVGWPAIAGTMLVESTEYGGAGLTLDQTTQMFGLAVSVNYLSPLFLGVILDRFGPRTASVVSNTFVAVGCFIFASSTTFMILTIGICMVGFGGPGVQTSLIHIGNLFPDRRFFVMGIVSETITLSFAVLPFMDVLWDLTPPSFGFQWCFGILGVAVGVSAVCSSFLWPDSPYMLPEDPVDVHKPIKPPLPTQLQKQSLDSYLRENSGTADRSESFYSSKTALAKGDMAHLSLKDQPFKAQVLSGVFARVGIFFLVTSFWANFYIATVTVELGDQQQFDLDQQRLLTRLLSFIDAGAIICAPLSGYLLDDVGFNPTAVVTITLGVLQMIFLMVAGNSVNLMTLSFVAYAVFRAFLFPYFFASLSQKCGFKYFGMLTGIGFTVSGLFNFLIAPVATIVEGTCHEFVAFNDSCTEGSWAVIHGIQIVVMLLLLFVPFIDNRIENKKVENNAYTLLTKYGSIDEEAAADVND